MKNSQSRKAKRSPDTNLLQTILKNQSEWDWALLAERPIHISTAFRSQLSLTNDHQILPETLIHKDSLKQLLSLITDEPEHPHYILPLHYEGEDQVIVAGNTHIKVVQTGINSDPVILGKIVTSTEGGVPPLQSESASLADYKMLYQMMRLICDYEPDVIWAKDTQKRYLFANEAMCSLLLNAENTDEPIGKTDQFFADRECAAHPENPNWHDFGRLCSETDDIVLKSLKREKFVEQGNVKGKFLALEVYKAPFYAEDGTLIGIVGSGRDITQQLEKERQLQLSEKHFNIFAETLPGAVFVCAVDQHFTLHFINNEIEQLTGYSKESFARGEIGFLDLICKEDAFRVMSELSNALTDRKAFHAIFRLTHRDGKIRWLDIRGSGIYEDAKPTRIQGFVSDLTVLMNAELKQREHNEKFRMLLNNIRDGVYVYEILPDNSPGHFLEVNDIACRQLGYVRREFLEMTPYHISEPDVFAALTEKIGADIAQNGESVCRVNHVTKFGKKIPVELFTRRLTVGEQVVAISVARDLSERLQAQEALEESQLRFEFFMKQLTAVAFIKDENFQIIYANPSFEKHFGEGVRGKTFEQIFSGEHSIKFSRSDAEVLKYGMVSNEYTLPDKQGTFRTWLFSTFKVPRLGKPPLIGGVGIDITRQKDIEYELIKAKDDAEQLNHLKTSLLTNLSHEVRTPMNGIIGFSEIMFETAKDDETRKNADSIHYSAVRLMRTLDSMLMLSTLESHIYTYRPEVINVNALLKKIISGTRRMLEEKPLSLTRHWNDEFTAFVDRELLEECLRHLVENAVKFTKAGDIHITCSDVVRNNRAMIKIEISDTGIGIAPENFQKIFDAFKQVSEGYGREFEGIGLGLTISRKMLELMDGQIELTSELGVGSTFSVFIPLHEKLSAGSVAETIVRADLILPTLEGVDNPNILLVEDNIANIELVQVYLMHRCKLDFCRNVKHALEMVAVCQYHAVLVDIHLGPGVDGVAFVQRLKQMDAYKYVPVIAVTGYVSREEKERIMAAGFNEFIAKPYSRKTLLTCLAKYYPAILKTKPN
jgi:PAS domain S-box-containing protein